MRSQAGRHDRGVNVVEGQEFRLRAQRTNSAWRRVRAGRHAFFIQASWLDQATHEVLHGVGQQLLLVTHRDRVIDHHQQIELVRNLVAHELDLMGRSHRAFAAGISTGSRIRTGGAGVSPTRAGAGGGGGVARSVAATCGATSRTATARAGDAGGAGRPMRSVVVRVATRHGQHERK